MTPTHRRHTHRFIQLQGRTVTGIIPFLNFEDLNIQQTVVYMGQFGNNPAVQWHEDLSKLRPGSWVYYEEFNGQVTHIGQNFLFKALFCHSDTIPPGQETCTTRDQLCPRCQMFGITTESDQREVDAGGYRGRFKSSTLVSEDILDTEGKHPKQPIPYEGSPNSFINVDLLKWKSNGKTVARQFLMPIAGSPKPNKRDIDGYFNPLTGYLKGPKKFRHGTLDVLNLKAWEEEIVNLDKKIERNEERKFIYSHKLRNYAVVCESGITFTGTVGAENCSSDEAAALLMLLETRIAGHGFKIGLGKSRGMGSITSVIKRIWIRTTESDKWVPISSVHQNTQELEAVLEGVTKALERLLKVQDINKKINKVEGHKNIKLKFPENLRRYWSAANNTGLNG